MEYNIRNSKILICYPEPVILYNNYAGKNHNQYPAYSETELANEINEILKAVSYNFPNTKTLSVGRNLLEEIEFIKNYAPDLVINLVESYRGLSKGEIYFASILELLNIKYTGNKPDTLTYCLDKNVAKLLLKANNLLTPNFFQLKHNENIYDLPFDFPVITKLNSEDASIGISEFSVCYNFKELNEQLNFLRDTYITQDFIIEEYIEGREFNIAIFNDKILPISEIIFDLPENLPKIVTYEAKWDEKSLYYNSTIPQRPARISKDIENLLKQTAFNAYKVFKCNDGVRVDIRLTKDNKPYILEINPNPDLTKNAGFIGSYMVTGKTYEDFFYELITSNLANGNNSN